MNPIKNLWNYLVGSSREFSMESRTYHSASVIAIKVLLGFIIVNFILGFWQVFALSVICFFIQLFCYSLSRFLGYFRPAVIGSALLSYTSLIVNYSINSGIDGPTLFIFLFTFNLLIIVTPNKLRYIWLTLHGGIVAGLMYAEYNYPELITDAYTGKAWRVFDIYLTYIIALIFIYYVSVYLRNYYHQEKELAETRSARLVEKEKIMAIQETDIREKNEALTKIAFMQSHELRAPVSSIMGLMSMMKEADFKNSEECLLLMETAVYDLDKKIRLIVQQTEEIKAHP